MTIRDFFKKIGEFSLLPPKDKKFYDYFCQMIGDILLASNKLIELFAAQQDNEGLRREILSAISALEGKCDTTVKLVTALSHKSPQPPFSRDDISNLMHQLDDIMDSIKESASVFMDSGLHESDPTMRMLAQDISMACQQLSLAIALLPKRGDLQSYVDAVYAIEGHADREYHDGLKRRADKVQTDLASIELMFTALDKLLASDQEKTRQVCIETIKVMQAVFDQSRHTALFAFLRIEYQALESANNACKRVAATLYRMVVSNG